MKYIFYPIITLLFVVGIPFVVATLMSPTWEWVLISAFIVIAHCVIQFWARAAIAKQQKESREEYKRRFPNG